MAEVHAFSVRTQPVTGSPRIRQEEGGELAPRRTVVYVCPRRHEFGVPFADEDGVEIPVVWRCRRHGVDGTRHGHRDITPPPVPYADRRRDSDGRDHWDRLQERRTPAELDALLRERLALMGCTDIDALPAPGRSSRRRR